MMNVPEVIYTTPRAPDCTDAREVLAFVLLRPETFAEATGDEPAVVAAMLAPAKREAIETWLQGRRA